MSERALAYSEEPLSNRFLVLIEAGYADAEGAAAVPVSSVSVTDAIMEVTK